MTLLQSRIYSFVISLACFLLLCISPLALFSQNCGDTVYDSGGASTNYGNNENSQFTITATADELITISFSAFDVESGYDYLRIYDGPNTSATLLAQLDGSSIPSDISSSGNTMTIRFTSDGSVTEPGYAFSISCAEPPEICYAIGTGNGMAELYEWSNNPAVINTIGEVGQTTEFESMALNFDGTVIYSSSGPDFGIVNMSTGAFTSMGAVGDVDGALGVLTITDIDGMAINPNNGLIMCSHRRSGDNDIFLAINPLTGKPEKNYFGKGVDYREIVGALQDMDDIAFHPTSNELFGISTVSGSTTNDQLVLIDQYFGTVSPVSNLITCDIEGLTFNESGDLLGVLGFEPCNYLAGTILEIDYSNINGTVSPIIQCPQDDTESLVCFVPAIEPCISVVDPGEIGDYQFICESDSPSQLVSISNATSSSGSPIVYQWYYSTTSCIAPLNNDPQWIAIPGATSATYTPSSISERTCFARASNTNDCTTIQKFSNVITIDVRPCSCPSMTTVSSRVNQGIDDAEEDYNGAIDINSSDLELIEESSDQTVGMRFQNISVPIGATILSARVEFVCDEASDLATDLTFRAELNPNPISFAVDTNNITNRPLTSNSRSWTSIVPFTVGSTYYSTNLDNVIQEVIDQSGWASGNSIAIIVTGTGKRVVESYNGSNSTAPRLIIEYCVQEICGNGLDDDGDGLIDCEDDDCVDLPGCQGPCVTGQLFVQRWNGVAGTSISNLTSLPTFPNSPSEIAYIYDFNGPNNIADNFGTRVSGYIIPSESGTFTFNITGDDNTELYLSTSNIEADKSLIASITGWAGEGDHTKYPSQTSVGIDLLEGVWYFVELLSKEGGGGDNFEVYWRTPSNSSNWVIIPETNIAPSKCPEICDNNADDDGDGDEDCLDADCINGINISASTSDNIICVGESTTLSTTYTGTPGLLSYQWSHSAGTTPSVNVSPIVTTTYTVTVTNSGGCEATSQVLVTVNPLPNASASNDGTITCSNTSVTLTALPAGMNYSWSGGGSNQTKSVTAGGNYIVTVTDGNGCTAIASTSVISDTTLPTANAGNDVAICTGESTTLSANGGISYLWDDGSTNPNRSVSPISITNYTVTVTAANGCTDVDEVQVTVNVLPIANLAHDGVITCNKTSALLTATPAGLSYLWTGGSTSQTINVNNGNEYFVTVTDGNGCSDITSISVPVDTISPLADAGTDVTICNGESTTLVASGAGTYLWSDGSSNASLDVSPIVTTDYFVTVTGTNGCEDIDTVSVIVNSLPVVICQYQVVGQSMVTGDCSVELCAGEGLVLTADPNFMASYEWSGPNGFSGLGNNYGRITLSNNLTAAHSGDYTVIVTDGNGCTGSNTISVLVNPLPNASVSHDGSITCSDPSATFTAAPAGLGYLWSDGTTNQTISVSTGDEFFVTVTNGNGCTDVTSISVPVDTISPTANAGLDVTICNGESTTLVASGVGTYLWSDGSTNSNLTVSPSVTTSYIVTVTAANGCSDSDNITVAVNELPEPTASNNGPLTCAQSSVTLTAQPAGMTYLWSDGSTSQTTSVSATGVYSVVVTDGNSCSATAFTTVTEDISGVEPTMSIDGIITCDNPVVNISVSPSNKSYDWSTGETGNNIDVSTGGDYYLTLTNNNGCQTFGKIQVVEDNATPYVSITNDSFCVGASQILTPDLCEIYPDIEAQRPLNLQGWQNTYGNQRSALVGDGMLCFTIDSTFLSSTQMIGLNDLPFASNGHGDLDYVIYPNVRHDLNRYQIQIRENGVARLTVTYTQSEFENSKYCISRTDSTVVYLKDDVVLFTSLVPSNDDLYYDHSIHSSESGVYTNGYSRFADISLCGDVDLDYSWSNTETTKSISVSNGGEYTLTVTDAKGCESSSTSTVSELDLPIVTVGNDGPITCSDTIVTLTANPSGMAYSWSNGSTSRAIDITENGTYTVQVTDGNLCSDSAVSEVTTAAPPTVLYLGTDSICIGEVTNLSPATGGSWSSSDTDIAIISNSGQVVGVSGGTATFTFTQGNTGCSTKSTTLRVSPEMTIAIDYIGGVCLNSDSQLGIDVTGGTSPYSYNWSGPSSLSSSDAVIDITESGNYYITVTDAFGCVEQTSGYVYQSYSPFILTLQSEICEGESIDLEVNSSSATGYQWSSNAGNSTTALVTVTPGPPQEIYSVTVTNNLGCTAVSNITIDVNPKTPVLVTGNDTICVDETTTLSPTTGGTWITSNAAIATVTSSGVVTGLSGGSVTFVFRDAVNECDSDPTEPILIQNKPNPIITGPSTICEGEVSSMSPSSGGVWSSSDTDVATILNNGMIAGVGPGTVTFSFTSDDTGCVSDASSELTIHEVLPVSITGDVIVCEGDLTYLSPTSGGTWTSSDTDIATVSNIGIVNTISEGEVTFIFESDYSCVSDATDTITVLNKEIITISGDDNVCKDDTISLAASLSNGTWSSGNPSIATIDQNGDVVGVAAGSVTMTYTPHPDDCAFNDTHDITVLPKANVNVSGSINICVGEVSSVTTSTSGGQWFSTDELVAVVSSDGTVVGINEGTVGFIYQNTNGCFSDTTTLINVHPAISVAIEFGGTICLQDNSTLTANTIGGTPDISYLWTGPGGFSSTLKTIDVLISGNYTVAVSDDSGCTDQTSAFVYEAYEPFVFNLNSEVCDGEEVTLSVNNSNNGGFLWSANAEGSTNQTVTVTPSLPGETYYVTVTNNIGCTSIASAAIAVNPIPAITLQGENEICQNSTTNFTPNTGGNWSSSDYSVAPINDTGVATGLNPGTAFFTFRDISTGCYSEASETITVIENEPILVSGDTDLCMNVPVQMTATESNGIWISHNPLIATIDSNTGIVTPVSAGSTSIEFQNTSPDCLTNGIRNITVHNTPSVNVSGPTTLCQGDLTYLIPTSGGTWTSNNTDVATVSNIGVVTGVSEGIVSFTFTSAFGCVQQLGQDISVIGNPIVSLEGPSDLCIGESTSLTSNVAGIWISSNNNVATVNSAGIITSLQAGTAEFIFVEFTNGCIADNIIEITVHNSPTINGLADNSLCPGETTSITPNSGGIWTSSDPSIASIDNLGNIIAISPGAATFIFEDSITGCVSPQSGQLSVDISPSITVNGNTEICVGETSSMLPNSGGVWTSSDISIATIDNQGIVNAISSGVVNFTFIKSSTGCTSSPSEEFTISNPSSASITGPLSICMEESVLLVGSNSGTWSSNNLDIGTVNNSGMFTAIAPGVVTITLETYANCIDNPTIDILVDPLPITQFLGATSICIGSTTNLSPLSGGEWQSNDESVATITNDGTVTAVGEGSAEFTYTDFVTGCTATTTSSLNVYGKPIVAISGDNEICIGGTTSLSPNIGGIWSSTNTTVATIQPDGVVTAISAGEATFIFSETESGCVSDPSLPITILATPQVFISGDNTLCIGESSTLSPDSGGSWISDNPAAASVTETGVVTALAQGIAKFTFISDLGCVSNKTAPIIVFGSPSVIIDGPLELCIGEETTIQPASGGTWISSDPAIASIMDNGTITAIAPGDVTFTYTDSSTGCFSEESEVITVSNIPSINLGGPQSVCIGGSTNFFPSTGGVWTSTDPDIATISNAGEVTGVSDGEARFIFTKLPSGCLSDTSIAITVSETLIPEYVGASEICIGDTVYILPSTGGTWTSDNNSIASIDNSGMIIGKGQGITSFQFIENTSGCQSSKSSPLTVNAGSAISLDGPSEICIGTTTQLSPSSGGTWESLHPTIATVDNSGLVSGISQGSADFVFTDSATGCISDGNINVQVQNGQEVSITGESTVCVGYTTTLSPSTGGFWSSKNPEIATISNSGIVKGLIPGKASFIFTDAITGCVTDAIDQVVTVENCLNHDFNVSVVGLTISGNVNTNDIISEGATYGAVYQLIEKPAGSLTTLTISDDGSYSFNGNKAGNYRFNITVCRSGEWIGCPSTFLEVSVVDNIYSEGNPATNLDVLSTYGSTDVTLPGTSISVDACANDKCVYTSDCSMDLSTMNIIGIPKNGTVTLNELGDMTYTPNNGYIGLDTIYYELCTEGNLKCNSSMQIVSVMDSSAENTLSASDDFNFTIAGVPISGQVISNDSDPEADLLTIVPQGSLMSPIIGADGDYFIDALGNYLFTPNEGFSGNTEIIYTVCDNNPNQACREATLHILVFDDISLNIRVYIEGALKNNGNEESSQGHPLMRDDLRVSPFNQKNSIPLDDPYTVVFNDFSNLYGSYSHLGPHLYLENQRITDSLGVFSVEGENAIVDWIHIELRSKDNMNLPIASRSGLLQRDGDVVDLDGVSPLRFQGINVDSCYVVANHRSHLGVMSQKIHFSNLIDFTSTDFPVFDFGTSKNDGSDYTGLATKNTVKSGYRACWAGDADANKRVKFSSPGDDQNFILFEVLFSSPDFLVNYDGTIGYFNADYDMNSKTKYTNPNDDKNLLFSQILLYPLNTTFIANYNGLIEQVPSIE